MCRALLLTIVFIFFAGSYTAGQVSQGGRPLVAPVLKSRGVPEIKMPAVFNKELKLLYGVKESIRLKPLQFAHGFDVDISPEKDGVWVRDLNGYDVWRIKIKSAGAYSLNLIFDRFYLAQGARLFLFNEKEEHYLGAYTSDNNKKSGRFAVSPIAGDEVIVQYEVPSEANSNSGFIISQVNHDFLGILKDADRRPMGIPAGECNEDINCEGSDTWKDVKDAVCRIIVHGREICSGVLVNNTAEDKRPYILSAAHCYDKPEYAQTSVFTFNYESPYCAPLDGDPQNSIDGAEMKAFFDSLDFSLVELSMVPPPGFHPFFSGWDRSTGVPDSSKCIHHPQGDIKKISTDRNRPFISNFLSAYTRSGFLRVAQWETGATEAGSSGGPLFNPLGHVIGTLTGGVATCEEPVDDYFSRFGLAWDFKSDSLHQLRHWLDPLNKGNVVLRGNRHYEAEDYCTTFTNLEGFDEHQNVILQEGGQDVGYWGGSNDLNITEFVERFSIPGDEVLTGVSMGVGMVELTSQLSNSEITIKVYNGREFPEALIYSQKQFIRGLVSDAMNLIPFNQIVMPSDTFFVGFELTNLQPQEKFVAYQSLRSPGKENFFWFKRNQKWYDFKQTNSAGQSMVNVFELVACNVNENKIERPLVNHPLESVIYPNPARSIFTFEAGQEIFPDQIKVFNLLGQQVNAKIVKNQERKVQIDLSGNTSGVYFVRFNSVLGNLSGKVMYNPW